MLFFFDGITAFLSYQVFETASFVLSERFCLSRVLQNALNVFARLSYAVAIYYALIIE